MLLTMSSEILFLPLGAIMIAMVVMAVKFAKRWKRGQVVKHLPESMREGSELVTVPLSQVPFVVGIFVVKRTRPDKKEFRGSGTIMGGYVIIAKHEIDAVYPVLDDGKPSEYDVYCRTFDGKYHLLVNCIDVFTDAVAFKAPEGYKSGKIETCTRPQHAAIYSARENSNSSMGILKPDQDMAYGFLSYSGSTLAGFSGGPYTNGSKILGLHLGGGTAGNFGYSASFIMSKIKLISKVESSEWEAFERALSKCKKEDIEYYRGLDTTQVYVGGRFFEFENEEFDEYIEESEFLDWFFDSDPDTDEIRFKPGSSNVYTKNKRGHQQLRGDVRVYNPEGYEPAYGENSFLVTSPPQDTNGGDLRRDIDSLSMTISQIQSTLTSQEASINGLKEQVASYGDLSDSIRNIEERLKQSMEELLTKNMSGLEQALTKLIESNLENLRHSEKPTLISTIDQPSEPSTCKPVVASAPSKNTIPSVKRWDGMESHFAMLKTWRNSADWSSPDYGSTRDAYLKSLGLEPWQCQILVNRLQNWLIKQRNRLAKAKKKLADLQTELSCS